MQKFTLNILLIAVGLCSFSNVGKKLLLVLHVIVKCYLLDFLSTYSGQLFALHWVLFAKFYKYGSCTNF